MRFALTELLEAYLYAQDTDSARWDFAVSLRQLQKLGLKPTDFRWLVRKGYVEHAREVTVAGHDGREFRPTGNLTFHKRTCFVLTDMGVDKARSMNNKFDGWGDETHGATKIDSSHERNHVPHWNAETRELQIDGRLVKRFKWQAVNQEIILEAFEEEGWPIVIDDPLPPKAHQDSKGRLQDTIKALNRNHENTMIRFHGNGTGDGIRWELIDC